MGSWMGHPGKKLLFMGQDFGQMDEWNEKESLEWGLLKYDIHSQMKDYVKALNHLYPHTAGLSIKWTMSRKVSSGSTALTMTRIS